MFLQETASRFVYIFYINVILFLFSLTKKKSRNRARFSFWCRIYPILRPQNRTALFSFISGLPRGVCASIFSNVFVFSGNENEKWVRICRHPLCRISGPKVQFYSAVVIQPLFYCRTTVYMAGCRYQLTGTLTRTLRIMALITEPRSFLKTSLISFRIVPGKCKTTSQEV